jgi:uncharacterized delta-60 repeat protein
MYHSLVVAMAVLAVSSSALDARANPGDLDPSFAVGGKLSRLSFAGARAAVLQTDGKIDIGDLTPLRLRADGTADPTYTRTGSHVPIDSASDMALRYDGRIIFAGFGANPGEIFPIFLDFYQALTNGTLDPSFADGTRLDLIPDGVRWSGGETRVVAMDDGRLLAVGDAVVDGQFAVALVRVLPDGQLDPTFGTGGLAATFLQPQTLPTKPVLLLQPDGRIVLARTAVTATGHVIAVVRFLADGSLDSSFGAGGSVRTAFDTSQQVSDDVLAGALQEDGGIVIAGRRLDLAVPRSAIEAVRYDSTGALDPSFGSGGRVVSELCGSSMANAAAIDTDGRIVLAGSIHCSPSPNHFALFRFLPDGTPDPAFGSLGVVATDFGPNAEVNDLTIQTDGKLLAVGADIDGLFGQIPLIAARVLGDDPCATRAAARVVKHVPPALDFRAQADSDPSDARLRFAANIRLPHSAPFSTLDPQRDGALVQLASAGGLVRLGVKIPGGAFSSARRFGWTTAPDGHAHFYRDLRSLPPGGIDSVRIVDHPKRGRVHVEVRGQGAGYPVEVADFPLSARVVLSGPAAPDRGVCVDTSFAAVHCRLSGGGDYRCRAAR